MMAHAANENEYIMLRVCNSKCIEETSGLGDDDIHVGGVAIYHDFRTKTFNVNLGKFTKGTIKQENKKLVSMRMWGGDPIEITLPGGERIKPFRHNPANSHRPKIFGAVVFLAEVDFGGFSSWIYTELHPLVNIQAQIAKQRLLENLEAGNMSALDASFIINDELAQTLAISALKAGGLIIGDDIFIPEDAFISTHINSYVEFPNSLQGNYPRNTENEKRIYTLFLDDGKYRLRLDFRMYK